MPKSKPELRRTLRARRRELVAGRDLDADGSALAGRGLTAAQRHGVPPGGWVALYDATPVEPPTTALLEALQAYGIRVMLPVTLPDLDLDWREPGTDPGTVLGRDAIGWARLVFAPALAVDRHGNRLGQGGGCYDRALARAAIGTRVVALLHPGELSEDELPSEPHDRRVDGFITAETGP